MKTSIFEATTNLLNRCIPGREGGLILTGGQAWTAMTMMMTRWWRRQQRWQWHDNDNVDDNKDGNEVTDDNEVTWQ
jgi:hypothetical protein